MISIPSGFSVLARGASRYPRFVIREPTLSNLTSVFPIVSGTKVAASGARGLSSRWCSRVSSGCWCAACVCFGYLGDVNGVALHNMTKLEFQALIMSMILKGIIIIIARRGVREANGTVLM